jgi:putative transposase
MGYVLRTSLPDGTFHVWMRGVCDIPPFPDPQDRTAALGLLTKAAARFELDLIAACVLTTHYHAVIAGPTSSLSCAMQWFHAHYARGFNRRYSRFGHVFAERFACRTVDEDGVFDRCAYVLANPINAGLCDRIEDWPWSWSKYGLDVV